MAALFGTEISYDCDTLLLSCGLLPGNELSRGAGVPLNPVTGSPLVNEGLETGIPGVFAAGNVLHVHDLVDYVTQEAAQAGENAANYVLSGEKSQKTLSKSMHRRGPLYGPGPGPSGDKKPEIRLRVDKPYRNKRLTVCADGVPVLSRKRPVLAPGEMETLDVKALPDHFRPSPWPWRRRMMERALTCIGCPLGCT